MKRATKREEPRRETEAKRDELAKGRGAEIVQSDSNGCGLVEQQARFAKAYQATMRKCTKRAKPA
jgi:hypothetical protein